ncbi:DUF3152 domain-containing protein [Catellatospora chokoriensis]|uniref:DUF3152 domain-containing protein n=1 Tax=Catellatospora chokoriensis TaxID=310353 RepID=A0A8J3NSK5_9ACTN|nr:DUF3152 domain-containing protein [Catellatospora chokoriensis]GIF91135.1 hypothetical protein Cch02nite_45790 [Catellatospora chokoriensis]
MPNVTQPALTGAVSDVVVRQGRSARSGPVEPKRRRPHGWIALVCLAVGAVLVGLALLRGAADAVAGAHLVPGGVTTPSPVPSAPATASPSASPLPVYQLPGDFPASGPGTWRYATGMGGVLGGSGGLRRFRVAAETNLAGAELAEFTRMVDLTLGDPRSWIGGQRRLQRVPAGSAYDFTIYLATGETTRKLCATGGMDTRLDGVSYTSCRLPGRVVINFNRWRLSVPDYVEGHVELALYRRYVINHEVGHELGRNHERCPGRGRPAPVMQQQTYGLQGCRANPWPYLDGKRYAGPPM